MKRLPAATIEALAVLLVLAVLVAVGVGGFFLGRDTKHGTSTTAAASTQASAAAPVNPQVAAGAHHFVSFACAQCHGVDGRGGISPDVPSLTTVGKQLTPAQLRHIINHGLGESANPTKPYMPVWGEVISQRQVSDLVAYIRAGLPAVPTADAIAVPSGQGAAVAGAALYVRYGCINCHGPNGLGGVPNPQSPDKTIPPLSRGAGFSAASSTRTPRSSTSSVRAASSGKHQSSACLTGVESSRMQIWPRSLRT